MADMDRIEGTKEKTDFFCHELFCHKDTKTQSYKTILEFQFDYLAIFDYFYGNQIYQNEKNRYHLSVNNIILFNYLLTDLLSFS